MTAPPQRVATPRPGRVRDVAASSAQPAPPPIDSRDLLGDAAERLIRHGGNVYRLRVTRAGKLILTK